VGYCFEETDPSATADGSDNACLGVLYTTHLRRVSIFLLFAVFCHGQTIRVWGSPQMSGLLRLWEQGFQKHHPEILFHDELHGTASGIAGLYTGVADLAVMGREIWPMETLAFQSVFPWKPLETEVGTGSYDIPKSTYALVVYVHKSNPLSKLTMAQLAAAFGSKARTWGDLGLTGEWAGKAIHTYNFDYENDKALFFRRSVFQDRYRWDSATTQFSNQTNSHGETVDSGQLILEALARDPLGIAVSNPHYANRDVKALALDDVAASVETVRNRTYPLTRAVYIYVNRDPQKPLDAPAGDFLRYVLSAEGQQDVAREGTYLPLPLQIIAAGLQTLR
jgi:phosphate transport system substrate-binding protein